MIVKHVAGQSSVIHIDLSPLFTSDKQVRFFHHIKPVSGLHAVARKGGSQIAVIYLTGGEASDEPVTITLKTETTDGRMHALDITVMVLGYA